MSQLMEYTLNVEKGAGHILFRRTYKQSVDAPQLQADTVASRGLGDCIEARIHDDAAERKEEASDESPTEH